MKIHITLTFSIWQVQVVFCKQQRQFLSWYFLVMYIKSYIMTSYSPLFGNIFWFFFCSETCCPFMTNTVKAKLRIQRWKTYPGYLTQSPNSKKSRLLKEISRLYSLWQDYAFSSDEHLLRYIFLFGYMRMNLNWELLLVYSPHWCWDIFKRMRVYYVMMHFYSVWLTTQIDRSV